MHVTNGAPTWFLLNRAIGDCQGMLFVRERGECGGDFFDGRSDVGGCGGGVALAEVSGESTCDGVAEVPLDPCQRGVADPVGAHLLRCDPRQMLVEPLPETVVSAPGDRVAVAVAQKLLVTAAPRSSPTTRRCFIIDGETGCQRTVPPFSKSRTRHWSGSRHRSRPPTCWTAPRSSWQGRSRWGSGTCACSDLVVDVVEPVAVDTREAAVRCGRVG